MKDENPRDENRRFRVEHVGGGYYLIVSSKNTVLDDWGGIHGHESASFQPNDGAGNSHVNRKWEFTPIGNSGYFFIRSENGVVLDCWGGETGKHAAALQKHDGSDVNRKWRFIPWG